MFVINELKDLILVTCKLRFAYIRNLCHAAPWFMVKAQNVTRWLSVSTLLDERV